MMRMQEQKEGFKDFISFLDEKGRQIEFFVKILKVNAVAKFETIDGNIISIPLHRVLKIKQKGGK